MHVGDRIRLCGQQACRTLGVPLDEVGVVRSVEEGCPRATVLISFPGVDVYTSALQDSDVVVLGPDLAGAPVRSGRQP